jgi:fucose permease
MPSMMVAIGRRSSHSGAGRASVGPAIAAVTALQVLLFVALGLPDGALGVAWPSMRAAVDQPLGQLGVVLLVGTAGYVIGSPSVASVVGRVGTPRAMTAATAVAAAALGVWATIGSWWLLLAASFVLGVSRGMVDAGLNAFVALHGGVRRLGVLHGSYGIGTTVGALLVVASLATGPWRTAFVVMAVIEAALAVWSAWLHDRWPADVVAGIDSDVDDGVARAHPGVVIGVTMLCFAALVGAEYSTGAWSYTLLTDGRAMSATAAGLWVASYWIGLTAARFGLAALGHRIDRVVLLNVSCTAALAGVGLLSWDPRGLGPLGLPVAGLGFANIFPALVALTPDRLGAHRSSRVIGLSVAAASVGGAAVAAFAGVLVDRYGPWSIGPLLVIVTAVVGVLHRALVAVAPVGRDRGYLNQMR